MQKCYIYVWKPLDDGCNSGKGHSFPLFGWGLAGLTEGLFCKPWKSEHMEGERDTAPQKGEQNTCSKGSKTMFKNEHNALPKGSTYMVRT